MKSRFSFRQTKSRPRFLSLLGAIAAISAFHPAVAQQGVIVADDFVDTDLSLDPAWTPAENIGASPLWRGSKDTLIFSTDADNAKRVLGISGLAVPSDKATYITFEVRPNVSSPDFRPISISLVKTSTNSGYTIFAAPTEGYGPTGFASSLYPSTTPTNPVGVTGEVFPNSKNWEKIVIELNPPARRLTLTRNGNEVYVRKDIAVDFTFDRLEFRNILVGDKSISWELKNLVISDNPGQ